MENNFENIENVENAEKTAAQIAEEMMIERIYKKFSDNVEELGNIRTQISEGVLSAQNPFELLIKAIKGISILCDDDMFYNSNKENIEAVYGIGLEFAEPLKSELGDIEKRLEQLRRPELQDESDETRERIRRAILAHEKRAEYIKDFLKKNNK